MAGSKQDITNTTSEANTHDDIFRPFCKVHEKNQPSIKIRKYKQSSISPNKNSMKGDNHPAKQLANYKLPNSYAFFGTVHIKTSATMLIIFYMLSLAVANFTVDITTIYSSSFTYISTISTIVLFAILLALYGMWKELSLCLLPLIVIQILLGVTMILILAFSNFIEFHCFLIEACPGGRFLMLGMGSAIFCVSHCYCIVILWLCWKYFHYVEKKAELEQIWHVETTDDETDENILIHNMPPNANLIQC